MKSLENIEKKQVPQDKNVIQQRRSSVAYLLHRKPNINTLIRQKSSYSTIEQRLENQIDVDKKLEEILGLDIIELMFSKKKYRCFLKQLALSVLFVTNILIITLNSDNYAKTSSYQMRVIRVCCMVICLVILFAAKVMLQKAQDKQRLMDIEQKKTKMSYIQVFYYLAEFFILAVYIGLEINKNYQWIELIDQQNISKDKIVDIVVSSQISIYFMSKFQILENRETYKKMKVLVMIISQLPIIMMISQINILVYLMLVLNMVFNSISSKSNEQTYSSLIKYILNLQCYWQEKYSYFKNQFNFIQKLQYNYSIYQLSILKVPQPQKHKLYNIQNELYNNLKMQKLIKSQQLENLEQWAMQEVYQEHIYNEIQISNSQQISLFVKQLNINFKAVLKTQCPQKIDDFIIKNANQTNVYKEFVKKEDKNKIEKCFFMNLPRKTFSNMEQKKMVEVIEIMIQQMINQIEVNRSQMSDNDEESSYYQLLFVKVESNMINTGTKHNSNNFKSIVQTAIEKNIKNSLSSLRDYEHSSQINEQNNNFKGRIQIIMRVDSRDIIQIINQAQVIIIRNQDGASNASSSQDYKSLLNRKNQFLGCVAHDLRTPLNGIQICLEQSKVNLQKLVSMIKLNKLDKQSKVLLNNVLQFVNFASDNQQFSIQLTEDILDFVQISQDLNVKLRLSVSTFDLQEFIVQVYELMSLKLNANKVELKYVITNLSDRQQTIVKNCQKRLKQLLINMISNAIKFTQNGHICLKIDIKADNIVTMELQDTGAGIDPDKIAILGQPFQTFGRQLNPEGIGLGLFICKKIITQIGPEEQKLIINSKVGQGSSFKFNIYRDITKVGNNQALTSNQYKMKNINSFTHKPSNFARMSKQQSQQQANNDQPQSKFAKMASKFNNNVNSVISFPEDSVQLQVKEICKTNLNLNQQKNQIRIHRRPNTYIEDDNLLVNQQDSYKKILSLNDNIINEQDQNMSLDVFFKQSRSNNYAISDRQSEDMEDVSPYKSAEEFFKVQGKLITSNDYIFKNSIIENYSAMNLNSLNCFNEKGDKFYNIACVDDDLFQRFGLKNQIYQAIESVDFNFNYRVIQEFNSGEEVLEYFRQYNNKKNHEFDQKKAINLVILDIIMGKLSGIETANIIRQECKQQDIVNVVTVGYSSLLLNEQECQNFDIILTKPCQLNDLLVMFQNYESLIKEEQIEEEEDHSQVQLS